ncbi:MAG: isoprenylcysteine carboxylmethyltransferase family protein [Desulfuromonadales bacterium]|nr:MAG: isoprenylcysteine carboxylmethyltransferase family protein [Desulfuromonadales bacterium]
MDFMIRLVVFALGHSILALPTLQQWVALNSPAIFRFYRLFYNLVAIVTFGWVMVAWPLSPMIYLMPGAWSLLFHFLQLISLIMLARCAAQTGIGDLIGLRQMRGEPPDRHLVTTGCYGRVRHPLYSLSIVFFVLNPVMTLKWLLLMAFSALYFVVGAHVEENRLEKEHGAAYRRYRESVPMFVPKIR